MTPWKYEVFRFYFNNPTTFYEWLSDHGSEGWELVHYTDFSHCRECVFKRPVDES